MKKLLSLLLAAALLLSLFSACGGNAGNDATKDNAVSGGADNGFDGEQGTDDVEALPPEPEKEPYTIYDPTVMPEGGVRDGVTYVAYDGVVEHMFFHPVIAYPELAFDGDYQTQGLDDWMVTVEEFNRILLSL